MKPYYEYGGITIYHGDCREILPPLVGIDLLLTDPPYGNEHCLRFGSRGRLAAAQDYTPIAGNSDAFDPSHLLEYPKVVLFGANWYADRLPPSGAWIVWDKRDGITSNDFSDAELAWVNVGNTVRLFRHRWYGMIKDSEKQERRVHPTQKPVTLMSWIIGTFSLQTAMICDPYCGVGSTLVAAKKLGHRAVGIEIEERYCEIAARRLDQEVLQFNEAESIIPMSPYELEIPSLTI